MKGEKTYFYQLQTKGTDRNVGTFFDILQRILPRIRLFFIIRELIFNFSSALVGNVRIMELGN